MERLLSPNEAVFWLMNQTSPMNTVVVLRCPHRIDAEALSHTRSFPLPIVTLDPHQRPRWQICSQPGVFTEVHDDDDSWLPIAQQLNQEATGTEGHPPWRAVLIQHSQGSTLVVALLHALADARSALWVAHQFLTLGQPGTLAPACEEILPPTAYGRADAFELVGQWWLPRLRDRWKSIGPDRLAGYLATPGTSRLVSRSLDEAESLELRDRCQREQVSLHGAVAVALRDSAQIHRVRYAVDLRRFIEPALDDAPGIALSHVDVALPDEPFWNAARETRRRLRAGLASGAAGDALLRLPELLLSKRESPTIPPPAEGPDVTLSDLTSTRLTGPLSVYEWTEPRSHPSPQRISVTSSARAGSQVLSLSFNAGRLQIVSSSASDRGGPVLDALLCRLREALA